jgi:hypothetical protein
MGPEFFSYCPLINQTGCGLPYSGNSSDMSISATTEAQEFSFDKLFYQNDGKNIHTGVCIYKIGPPRLMYKQSTIIFEV